ncbi:outer membrane beta-barrel protein [Salinimicrobium soli]|uniref:outer membrane beta-barrel protein n=1 Tax=Salinimicrobium soli TaxID=1254399 RepID=UPI003AB065A7
MKERKHIDRIYQEKFRDFEATPNEAVWRSISAKLHEKERKRRVLAPLWTRMAGVAAILAIILLIGDWIFPLSSSNRIANQELEQELQNNTRPSDNQLALTPDEAIAENSSEDLSQHNSAVLQKERTTTTKRSPLDQIKGEEKGISNIIPEITSVENAKPVQTDKKKKKSLFEELKKPETTVVTAPHEPLFEVSTHAAPIYYGNFGKGNFLDPRFNDNNNQGEITYSYGIHIAYVISDRFKIRSGINKVNMNYNTKGIAYQAVSGPNAIAGVELNKGDLPKKAGVMGDIPGGGAQQTAAFDSNRASIGSLSPGSLNQEMGFIEVPVEIEYNLLEGRFELNLIGGASTLFLDENKISLNTEDFTAIGKATNLNHISFSTNLGLGLDYNLTNKFKLNLEPMLKYQINTFNAASGDSQPYYLGIYSGFKYKF